MAIYYVRASGGNDGNTGLSFAQGWATISHAIATVTTGGNTILICADGTHYPSAQINIPIAGSFNSSIIIKGASATGIDDGTVATISGNVSATGPVIYHNQQSFYKWYNIRFTQAKNSCFQVSTSANSSKINFFRCRFDNAASNGFYCSEDSIYLVINFVECEFDNNTQRGLYTNHPSTGNTILIINCKFHDNTLSGYLFDGYNFMVPIFDSMFYRNGTYGFRSDGTSVSVNFLNCIFDNNVYSGVGLGLLGGSPGQINALNCIFSNNSYYGISVTHPTDYDFNIFDYNCFYNNTSGDTNKFGGIPPGSHNIFNNPLFTSTTPGSEDYTLQLNSPCINTGYGYNG